MPLDSWLGDMTGPEAVQMLASARLDPDEEERADIRWALQMEALLWLGRAEKSHPALYWLQQLPWRPEFVSREERLRMEQQRARQMAEFAAAYKTRKKPVADADAHAHRRVPPKDRTHPTTRRAHG